MGELLYAGSELLSQLRWKGYTIVQVLGQGGYSTHVRGVELEQVLRVEAKVRRGSRDVSTGVRDPAGQVCGAGVPDRKVCVPQVHQI